MRAQIVSYVKCLDAAESLVVQLLPVWCCMEIEIATEYLIAAFTTQDHLDAGRLDLPAKQIHWGCLQPPLS